MEAVRTVEDSRSVLVHWMGPTDANTAGFVHGGVVMKLIDEVAGVAAVRHSHCRVVTAGADRLTFLLPIHVGELVTLRASVNAAWHTSMEVGVRVEAENPRTGEVHHTNTAYLTMVAVDDEGRPTAVPALRTSSPDELRREAEAQLRRSNRLAERAEILERRAREVDPREQVPHRGGEPALNPRDQVSPPAREHAPRDQVPNED